MKKLIFLIPLLLLIQPAFGEIIVENDQTYIGNDGILHIVGEIKNDSKSPVNKIKIIATLMDGDGKVTRHNRWKSFDKYNNARNER